MNVSLDEPPRIGLALAALRQSRAHSLDELSRLAGVSKSMLSQIERGQANPTVAVVWRLANALGVPMSDLLGGTPRPTAPTITVIPRHATPLLQGADGNSELRILGPLDLAGHFEWYELQLQPGGALTSSAHEPGTQEHVTVQSGQLTVEAGAHRQQLAVGETARYLADQPHTLRNEGSGTVNAWLVVLHQD